jgi:thioesterase domain-containing protein
LAGYLAKGRAVYGLRLLQDLQPAPGTFEEAAAYWVEEVRAIQQTGPYHFMGYSFGGSVAYEIACQLHQQGQSVALLALIDTPRTHPIPVGTSLSRRVGWQWKNIVALEAEERLKYVADRLHILAAWLVSAVTGRGSAQASVVSHLPPSLRRIGLAYWRLAQAYDPGSFAGHLLLFRATDHSEADSQDALDRYMGWSGLAKEAVEVHDMPGPHLAVWRASNIERVAKVVTPLLSTI